MSPAAATNSLMYFTVTGSAEPASLNECGSGPNSSGRSGAAAPYTSSTTPDSTRNAAACSAAVIIVFCSLPSSRPNRGAPRAFIKASAALALVAFQGACGGEPPESAGWMLSPKMSGAPAATDSEDSEPHTVWLRHS